MIAANSITPVGGLRGVTRNVTLDAPARLLHAEDFRSIVVAWRNGAPVRVSNVGNVVDSVENDKIGAWYGNQRAIMLAIYRQPDANTVQVVDAIRDKLPLYQSQLPPSIKAYVLHDRSNSIRQSVHDVQFTLMLTVALVVLVIFMFLKSLLRRSFRRLRVPVSLIGTSPSCISWLFDRQYFAARITFAVGFVVDDAIVMLENILRHIEGRSQRPFDAALAGTREIGFTILSISLSLVAVFIPVLLMGGVVGRVFSEFAVDDFLFDSGFGLRFSDADADALRADAASDRIITPSRMFSTG